MYERIKQPDKTIFSYKLYIFRIKKNIDRQCKCLHNNQAIEIVCQQREFFQAI
jgi:hypothetical protein